MMTNIKKENSKTLSEEAIDTLIKIGLSFQKNLFYLPQWKPFKSDEKTSEKHLKSFFCSQDI